MDKSILVLAWAGQDFDQPQIISMTLQPIQSLFRPDVLERYGINAAKINAWFGPQMATFCDTVNRNLPKSEQLQCTQQRGCGIDDNCSVDEICVPKKGDDYFCGKPVAAILQRHSG